MTRAAADFFRILQVLTAHKVEFVVVGGVGAVLQGAPISTFDLDLVHARNARNIEVLEKALGELNGYYRGRGEQRLVPGKDQLRSPGHQLLMTDAGPLDLLGEVGDHLGYPELLAQTMTIELDEGEQVRVLELEALLELKEKLGRDKDQAMLPVLRRTLEERDREHD